MGLETTLFLLLLIAGFYTAWNIGANDVANAMGISVGAGALTLRHAVLLAAIFEFSGAFFFGAHVSDTIQGGIIDATIFSKHPITLVFGMLAVLVGTGIWLHVASYFGWPVSTTHSIVGGMVGFGLAVGGMEAIQWDNMLYIVGSWIVSPLLGGIVSFLIFSILRKRIFYTSTPVANAKKMTPLLVFIFVVILSTLILFHGLGNVAVEFDFLQSTLISLFAAILEHSSAMRLSIASKNQGKDLKKHMPNTPLWKRFSATCRSLQHAQWPLPMEQMMSLMPSALYLPASMSLQREKSYPPQSCLFGRWL